MLKQPIEVNRKGRCDLFYLNKKKSAVGVYICCNTITNKMSGSLLYKHFFLHLQNIQNKNSVYKTVYK